MKIKLPKKYLGKKVPPLNILMRKGFLALFASCLFYSGTNAQITSGFELDGNATAVLPNPPDDWNLIFNHTSNAQVTTNIVNDSSNIFMGGGSKDDLDINNWGWTIGTVPDKDDILHGGVALYNNCKLYFFGDRYATNGSSNIGFWLFKSNISVSAGGTFTGLHTYGDVFIVSEFVNGGGTSVIKAYKWVGTGGNTNGTLDSVPLNNVNSFAITNSTSVPSPWPFVPKTGPVNVFGPGAFFEGGIDLCSLSGLDPCFTSFMIETRSSFSVDAVLKDFLNGSFTSTPQVSLAGGSRCSDGPGVTLNATVTGGITPYTFLWSPGGSTAASITVSPTVTTTYTFTVTGLNGCTNSATATVTVNPAPNVNAGIDKILNCITTSVTLNGSSSTSGATFSWSTIGGHIVSGGSTATPLVDAAGTYILTVSTPSSCTKKDTAMVTFNGTPPNVSAGADKTLNCLVTSVILNGSSSTTGATFSWSTISGHIVSGASTATPTVDAAGSYILTVTNPLNGCSSKDTAMVNQNITPPNVNAGPDKLLTCAATSVALSGSSSTGGALFSWITIGGHIVSGSSIATPLVDAAGTYILTVTNPGNGCIARDTVMVTQNITLPNVNAGMDTVINCYHTSIALNGSSSTSHVSYSWVTGSGHIVSGATTAHPIVDAAGTYTLFVTDSVNGCMASDAVVVNINTTSPNANAGPDKTLTCAATQVMLDGSSTTPGAIFAWVAINGGVILSGGTTATPIVQIPGTYILTVTNPMNGCTASDSADVFQNINAPNVDAGSDAVLTCSVTSIMLSGSSSTPSTSYLWTTIDGHIVSGATTLNPIVDASGSYMLTVTNTITGCEASDVAMVTLNITPPNANAGVDNTLTCTTTSLMLNGSSSTAGAIYSWTTIGGNIVSGGSTSMPTVNAMGTYILMVTDSVNGCTAKDTAMVMLNIAPPDANAGADESLTCIINSVMLEGSSSTFGSTFSWTTIGGNIILGANSTSPIVNAAGTYILTVTNSVNGCTAVDTAMVMLNNTLPDVDAGADSVINCMNPSIILHGSSLTANVSFGWTTVGGDIVSGGGTIDATVDAGGTYILTVTDNVNGCMANDTVMVNTNFTAPNANAGPDMTLTCVVTQVSLSGSSTTPGATFHWVATAGGVIVSGANTATPLVQIPGTYVMTVTNPVNGCTAADSANVFYDNTKPNVDAGGDMTLNCVVSSIMLDGSSTTTGATAVWTTFGGGNIVSGATTFNPTADMAGGYILTVTNPATGCTAVDTAMVMLNIGTPDVNAGADTIIGCGVAMLSLHGSSTSNVGFNWTTIGGHIVSGALTADAVIDASGIYILTVIDHINGCSASDTVVVNSSIPPVVDLGNDTTLIFCAGHFTLDPGNPGMDYLWSTGATTQTIDVMATGTYWVMVTNIYGCPSADTIHVSILPSILHVDLGNDTTFMNCHALTLTLDAGNTGGTFVWSTTETTQTIDVTTTGTYWVSVTDTVGCMASDSINVTIIDNNIDVDLGPDTTVCSCILLDAGHPGATFTWCSGQTYEAINVCATGTYCVTVSNGTCMDSDTVHITVVPPPVVNLGNDTVLVNGPLTLDAGASLALYMWSTGATTQTIAVTASGQYYVTVTDPISGCAVSDTINVTILNAVAENTANDFGVNIYPNPAADNTFTLSFSASERSTIEIKVMNVLGKIVYTDKLVNFSGAYKKTITLKDVAKGIYFTDVLSGTNRSTTKIIIE